MNSASWLAFVAALIIALAVPGPDLAVVLTAAGRSTREGLSATAGIIVGLCLHAAVAATGVVTLILSAPKALAWLQLAGAGVLCWLGVSMLRATRRQAAASSRTTTQRSFVTGFTTNASNPKALLFFAAVLPQFIPTGPGVRAHVGLLALTVVASAGLWWSIVVALVRLVGLGRSARGLRLTGWACGTTMVALAVATAALAIATLRSSPPPSWQ